MEVLQLQHELEGKSYTEVEIFAEVLGTKVGYVRGLGRSVRSVGSSSSASSVDLSRRLEEARLEIEEMRARQMEYEVLLVKWSNMEQTMREHLQMIEEQQRKKDEELMQMMAEQQRKKDEEHQKMMQEQQRNLVEQQERRMQLMAEQMREQLMEQNQTVAISYDTQTKIWNPGPHQLVAHASFLGRVVACMNPFLGPYGSGMGCVGPSRIKAPYRGHDGDALDKDVGLRRMGKY
ncbi:hypothetical protein CJ030_MR5G009678 [Morella rubra]|uniref:Uncharacterized protein n=1 Tax=Morella rubra TaxID=262757 RepID=A0A6A1VL95_9ROSI|nr:hypothetical protein CJ030_MR5G009678 [Morella rubra]